jgi:hypothetical protein
MITSTKETHFYCSSRDIFSRNPNMIRVLSYPTRRLENHWAHGFHSRLGELQSRRGGDWARVPLSTTEIARNWHVIDSQFSICHRIRSESERHWIWILGPDFNIYEIRMSAHDGNVISLSLKEFVDCHQVFAFLTGLFTRWFETIIILIIIGLVAILILGKILQLVGSSSLSNQIESLVRINVFVFLRVTDSFPIPFIWRLWRSWKIGSSNITILSFYKWCSLVLSILWYGRDLSLPHIIL